MTTDNRTNEPTPEQVEAAAATIAVEELILWRKTWGDLSEGRKQDFRSIARAALKAASVVPDAATEELEAQLTNTKAGWDSALRIVNEGNEIIKQVGAERDAAVTAIERVRALHPNVKGECHTCSDENGPKLWPCPTIQALDGAPEPEWEAVAEYGVKYAPTNNRASYTVRFGYESREDAEHSLGRLGRNQKRNPDRLMYREVRTGPWLPVEGESK